MFLRIVCIIVLVALAALAQPSQPLTATVSRNPINVGQTTVVTLSGGQLDVAMGGNIIGDIGDSFARAIELKQLDKKRFQVKGKAACDCVVKFSDGKNETTVTIKVVKK